MSGVGTIEAALGDGLRLLVWDAGGRLRAQVYRVVGALGPDDGGAVLHDRYYPLDARQLAVDEAVSFGVACVGGVSR